MKIRYAPLAVACALMVAASAQAAAVTYSFGGTVNNVVGVPSLSVGNAFTGSFTFEQTSPVAPNGGYDTNIVFEATVNGYSFSTTSPCSTCGGVSIFNDTNIGDRFLVSSLLAYPVYAPVAGPNLDGLQHYYLALELNDTTATAFSSEALPSNLTLASFDNSFFALSFLTAGLSQVIASGPLSYLTKVVTPPVPEASTSAMLALGLGALAFVRRRKSH